MLRTISITFVLVAMSLPSAAQTRSLTVIGEASVSETADQAYFTLNVSENGKTYDEAYSLAQQKTYRLTSALIVAGLDSSSIRQSQYSVGERSASFFYKDKRNASITIRVTVSDLRLLNKVFSALNSEKVDYISSVRFELRDKQKLNEAALNAAVGNARQKAQLLAGKQSLQLGNIQTIEEAYMTQSSGHRDADMAYMVITGGFNADYGSAEYQPAPALPEEIIVRKAVKVTFDLK